MKVRLDINEIENKFAKEMSDSHLVPWVGKPLTRSINDEYLRGACIWECVAKMSASRGRGQSILSVSCHFLNSQRDFVFPEMSLTLLLSPLGLCLGIGASQNAAQALYRWSQRMDTGQEL